MMYKPVFIFSLHRSGSTYLKNIIGASSEIAMLEEEVHFDHPLFSNTFRKYYLKYCNDKIDQYDDFLSALKNHKIRGSFWNIYKDRYNNFKGSKEFLEKRLDIWSSFNSILKEVLNDSSKNRIGIKYPTHFKYFEEFNRQYAGAKNVFLVRDPRAILASKIMSPTNTRLNNKSALNYELSRLILVFYVAVEFFLFIRTVLKNKSEGLILKYEDLVMDEPNQVKRICDYCDLNVQYSLLNADGKSTGYGKVIERKERINRWITVLRKYEVWILYVLTKKERNKMGYD